MRIKISITLPEDLLVEVDALVKKSRKRSEIIESVLRDYILKEERKELNKRDIEIINANAETLNKQALETLELQADLIKEYLENESSKRNEQLGR